MMDNKIAWMYHRGDFLENIDLNAVLKTTERVCSALGFKLANSWEAYMYMKKLPKLPCACIYL